MHLPVISSSLVATLLTQEYGSGLSVDEDGSLAGGSGPVVKVDHDFPHAPAIGSSVAENDLFRVPFRQFIVQASIQLLISEKVVVSSYEMDHVAKKKNVCSMDTHVQTCPHCCRV